MESLESKTVPELKDLAKAAGVPKYGGMNKGELIAALSAPQVVIDPAKPGADKSVKTVIESSSPKSDLENHPKFAKFKTGGKPL